MTEIIAFHDYTLTMTRIALPDLRSLRHVCRSALENEVP